MTALLASLRQEHENLVSKRKEVEDAYYNFATTECDMEEDATNDKIAKARSEPHKNARLQSIHEAHQAVLSKEAEISAAEADLAAYEAQCAKVRLEPHKRAHLQSIHETHQTVLSNDATTTEAEGNLPHVNEPEQNDHTDNAKKGNTQKQLLVCSKMNLCLRNIYHCHCAFWFRRMKQNYRKSSRSMQQSSRH